MKLTILAAALAAVVPAFAQNSTSNSTDAGTAYLTAVLGALQAANLTSLVGVASAIANTSDGMALLGQLAQGNKTVFAPSNAAFDQVPQNVSSNTTLLTQVLAYHILNNTYTANGTQVSPNHTIARTVLRGGIYDLPGNRTAPLVLARNSTNATSFQIIQATSNVSTQGPVAAANLYVYIIDQVLSLPGTIADVAASIFPSLAGVIQQSGLLDPLEAADAITVFAPNDAALQAAGATLAQLASNTTLLQTVLANHVINGTAVYSPYLNAANYTSAAGSAFSFMTNSSGTYVMSGNSTAKIVQSDIIINNGVVHLIDGVLANTNSNSSAAASAYTSNTAFAATAFPAPTSPQTATSALSPSGSASGSSGSSASSSRSASHLKAAFNWQNTLGAAVVGAVGVVLGGSFVFA